MTTITQATAGQKKQIARFTADVIEKVNVEELLGELGVESPGGQRVIENGDEYAARIREAARAVIKDLSVTDKFKGEEVASTYGYLSGYTKPIAISDQIDVLRSYWPTLKPDAALRYMRETYPALQHPSWVEGPFALVRPGFFSGAYGEELEEVLKQLAKSRDNIFVNYRKGQLGPDQLQQTERTLAMLGRVVAEQPDSDIIIVSGQFGIRHRGRSVRRAREVILDTSREFGHGAKDIGTMLLTNPIRLKHSDDLWIDAPGDRFKAGGESGFSFAPYFRFYDGYLRFDTRHVGSAYDFYGSASGCSPQ